MLRILTYVLTEQNSQAEIHENDPFLYQFSWKIFTSNIFLGHFFCQDQHFISKFYSLRGCTVCFGQTAGWPSYNKLKARLSGVFLHDFIYLVLIFIMQLFAEIIANNSFGFNFSAYFRRVVCGGKKIQWLFLPTPPPPPPPRAPEIGTRIITGNKQKKQIY
jgi:hypothetical protein